MSNAARGVLALSIGDRTAPTRFDFSLRGLAGSLIALLVSTTLAAFAPQWLGITATAGAATLSLLLGLMIYVVQMGIAYLVLRQLGRLDGFVPFLVADNWANFFLSFLSLGIVLSGGGEGSVIVIGLIVLLVEINVARLVVALAPMQVASFIIAQLVGSVVALLTLVALFPNAGILPPM